MQETTTAPASSAEHKMRHALALVLAGGRGSRLKDLTSWRAKPALPFGGKYPASSILCCPIASIPASAVSGC